MSLISAALIGLGLSMDACAVAMSCGIVYARAKKSDALKAAAFFGFFQALMPLIGYYLGQAVYPYIARAAGWTAFAVLAAIGAHMLYSAFRGSRDPRTQTRAQTFSSRSLLGLAVATSIDALAAGLSFALIRVHIWSSVAIIGAITFALSYWAVLLGRRAGSLFKDKAELVGGLILLLIALKILADQLR